MSMIFVMCWMKECPGLLQCVSNTYFTYPGLRKAKPWASAHETKIRYFNHSDK